MANPLEKARQSRWQQLAASASVLLATVWMSSTMAAEPGTETEASVPRVQEQDVRSLSEQTTVKQWRPGDPVRVVPDLREDGKPESSKDSEEKTEQEPLKPVVHGPVAPQVMDKDLEDLSQAESYQEGDPVRVVPDMRESDSDAE